MDMFKTTYMYYMYRRPVPKDYKKENMKMLIRQKIIKYIKKTLAVQYCSIYLQVQEKKCTSL